jgi:hypothetical protein
VLLVAALIVTVLGMGWLALAMDVHWKQVRAGAQRSRGSAVILRALGSAALIVSLNLCLLADTATMAVLVWMMFLALAAATIAFVLSSRPGILAPLIVFSRDPAGD